jgi:hypothetical protein
MSELPISVHILTWNSASTLRRALESVKHCRQILLIDGGSTDETAKIADEYDATIIAQPHPGKPIMDFAAARNEGLRHATEPWIFSLDSDEYASPALMEELGKIATECKESAAYLVLRKYVLPTGEAVGHASTYPNHRLYFFHRDAVTGWIKPVHERPALKPGAPIHLLRNACLAPIGTIEEYKAKNLRYIRIEAMQSAGKGWGYWLVHRLLHTLRSRAVALIRLLGIWLLPHRGKRLPLRYEMARFWYGWRLIVETAPGKSPITQPPVAKRNGD